jgi:hypothetical protein
MRWVTYLSPSSGAERAGLVVDASVHGLESSLLALLQRAGGLAAAAELALSTPAETAALDEVTLRAPVPRAPSVRDFLSFEEHAKNASGAFGGRVHPVWYQQPVVKLQVRIGIVRPAGLEPATKCLEGTCSVH